MLSDPIALECLERQKALIDAITSRVEKRAGNGEHVGLSLSLLRDERRLYRRMLSRAPLDVLEAHSLSSCFT